MYFIVILFSSNCLLNHSHKQLLGSKDPALFDRILGIFHIEHHKKLTCSGIIFFFFFKSKNVGLKVLLGFYPKKKKLIFYLSYFMVYIKDKATCKVGSSSFS